jgi:hypothetical protein
MPPPKAVRHCRMSVVRGGAADPRRPSHRRVRPAGRPRERRFGHPNALARSAAARWRDRQFHAARQAIPVGSSGRTSRISLYGPMVPPRCLPWRVPGVLPGASPPNAPCRPSGPCASCGALGLPAPRHHPCETRNMALRCRLRLAMPPPTWHKPCVCLKLASFRPTPCTPKHLHRMAPRRGGFPS